MVPRRRVERPTWRLGGARSIHLSYRGGDGLIGGAEEDRTPDLCIANASLSQLSYGPVCIGNHQPPFYTLIFPGAIWLIR
jgi:hypothetical protein